MRLLEVVILHQIEGTASSRSSTIHTCFVIPVKVVEACFEKTCLEVLLLQSSHSSSIFYASLRCASLPHSTMDPNPPIPASPGLVWTATFFDNFTSPDYALSTNFRHPMGTAKWKWDALSNKEIWWEPSCSRIVPDASSPSPLSKPILRVCVFSNWFHRIDRIATKQTFGYGYYESRLRFRGASGMHSAFWLLPEAMKDDPVAPGLILGGVEIDVVENRKVDSGGNNLSKQGNTAVHWGGYGANHKSVGFKLMGLPGDGGDPSVWATFGVWHFEGGMKWYWNGKEVNSANVWSPMRNALYFSTEVGESGGWAGVDLGSYGDVEKPEGFIEIDYCGFWEQVVATEVEGEICLVKDDEACGSKDEACQVINEACESKVEACGSKDEASGSEDEASGSNVEASGSKVEACGWKDEACEVKDEA